MQPNDTKIMEMYSNSRAVIFGVNFFLLEMRQLKWAKTRQTEYPEMKCHYEQKQTDKIENTRVYAIFCRKNPLLFSCIATIATKKCLFVCKNSIWFRYHQKISRVWQNNTKFYIFHNKILVVFFVVVINWSKTMI